jgi:SAM-dependent MidA family methyltransferase
MGLKNIGYTTQGRFIISVGIDEIIEELIKPEDYAFEVAGIKSLILPSGMGESHKIIVHYKGGGNPALRGFRLRNELSKL